MSQIAENLATVRANLHDAARQAGRDPQSVGLVAVSKTHNARIVAQAIAAGALDLGESRIQEASEKIELLISDRPRIRWHLIGHLQRNKAKIAAGLFDLIHSLDSLRLAETLARAVDEQSLVGQRRLPVLLQFNVSGEASKEGFSLAGGVHNSAGLAALLPELEQILTLPQLEVRGLMTIAPLSDDPDAARRTFVALRELRDELARRYPQVNWHELSMGMSDDYRAAIAEGSTLVRIGRAIFGAR